MTFRRSGSGSCSHLYNLVLGNVTGDFICDSGTHRENSHISQAEKLMQHKRELIIPVFTFKM